MVEKIINDDNMYNPWLIFLSMYNVLKETIEKEKTTQLNNEINKFTRKQMKSLLLQLSTLT
jgi:hypothetical protein